MWHCLGNNLNIDCQLSVDKDELKEELRADKAVKVSRKELNELIAELFEYTDTYENNLSQAKIDVEREPQVTVLHNEQKDDVQGESEDQIPSLVCTD